MQINGLSIIYNYQSVVSTNIAVLKQSRNHKFLPCLIVNFQFQDFS
jgi:hypothetical protein